jgi:nitrate reductase alpha subunit
LNHENNPDWKPVVFDERSEQVVVPNGTIGSRWGDQGKWNLEEKNQQDDSDIKPMLSFLGQADEVLPVAFPYFGNQQHDQAIFAHSDHDSILNRKVPVKTLQLAGGTVKAVTVYDLMLANYGLDRGLDDDQVAQSFDDDVPYTPAWQEPITGVKREQIIQSRCGDQPLVPHGYDLPRHYEYAHHVWLCWPEWRRLGTLCGPGKIAPTNRLAAVGLWA